MRCLNIFHKAFKLAKKENKMSKIPSVGEKIEFKSAFKNKKCSCNGEIAEVIAHNTLNSDHPKELLTGLKFEKSGISLWARVDECFRTR